jgi:hypothetical protein
MDPSDDRGEGAKCGVRSGILPDCEMCGETNPRRMIALMTRFFGPVLELEAESGYVYVCPDCYDRLVLPHIEEVRKMLHIHLAPGERTPEAEEEED